MLIRQGDGAGARKHHLEAMQLLPSEAYPRLRLSAEHNLACEQFRSGEYDAALERLAQAAPLYERYADALLRAHRLWLLGCIHLRRERWQEAEEALLPAVKCYLDLGEGHDVVRILFDLCTVYRCSNQHEMFQRFVILLNNLRQNPEVEALILDELRKVRQVISGSEAAQALSRVIDDLAARVEKPPN
jgi:tetratricopeptide (TPR) repeat protein